MIDAETLRGVKLNKAPVGQKLVAWSFLWPVYSLPKKTEIVLEGLENLPDRAVILAMNHTDRYNYWPFQYQMYRAGVPRFTATWVKGKYYENSWVARFMMATNNIPVPSRGYIIASRFREAIGRPPESTEYRVLRDLVDGRRGPDELGEDERGGDLGQFFEAYGRTNATESVAETVRRFEAEFDEVMREVVRLNQEAMFEHDLNLLIFPEGTRSLRLSKGRTGMAQMAQHLGATIVPVGCSGSDKAYPGNSPVAKGGRIVYRIGTPLEPHGPVLAPYRVTAPFTPLTREAAEKYHDSFQAITDIVMDRINALVDPEYQFGEPTGVEGIERFL